MNPRDYLADANVQAFLRMTRFCEGTADDDGYRRLVGGGEFESFADHPRKLIPIARYGIKSSAAGAFQFLEKTWDEMAALYKLPDFSPESQDLAAIGLIHRRGALEDVLAGRIESAIKKCNKEWASFHGSPYGQRTVALSRMLQEYRKWGGTGVAAPIVESKPTWEAPVTPFVAAALPALVQAIPELIRSFGKGEVSERNARAAETVMQVVQAATNTQNAQAAVEAVQNDPVAREAARAALQADHWFDVTEAGGGGIEGARAFSKNAIAKGDEFWRMGVFWITLALLPLLYGTVYLVLVGPPEAFSGELRAAIASSVVTGVLGGVIGFWLGLKFSAPKADAIALGR
ncbi:MAG: hypothetical protein QG615_1861 [Nitrospirota bacterium]|nr:hypothetical protein [Nitrospirota bacterium]